MDHSRCNLFSLSPSKIRKELVHWYRKKIEKRYQSSRVPSTNYDEDWDTDSEHFEYSDCIDSDDVYIALPGQDPVPPMPTPRRPEKRCPLRVPMPTDSPLLSDDSNYVSSKAKSCENPNLISKGSSLGSSLSFVDSTPTSATQLARHDLNSAKETAPITRKSRVISFEESQDILLPNMNPVASPTQLLTVLSPLSFSSLELDDESVLLQSPQNNSDYIFSNLMFETSSNHEDGVHDARSVHYTIQDYIPAPQLESEDSITNRNMRVGTTDVDNSYAVTGKAARCLYHFQPAARSCLCRLNESCESCRYDIRMR